MIETERLILRPNPLTFALIRKDSNEAIGGIGLAPQGEPPSVRRTGTRLLDRLSLSGQRSDIRSIERLSVIAAMYGD